jgi:NADH:ubiquinone oxidoreductase subunit D/NADH:ubiquinone oxidoreductase subunit C
MVMATTETETSMLMNDLREFVGAARSQPVEMRGEWTLIVAVADLEPLLEFLRTREGDRLDTLVDLTAVDRLQMGRGKRFQLVYQLRSSTSGFRLRLRVPFDPDVDEVESVVPSWPAANWLEREVYDMFGICFSGHPDMRRILLPETYESFPLRKDFPVDGFGPAEVSPPDDGAAGQRRGIGDSNSLGLGPLHAGMSGNLSADLEAEGEEISRVELDLGFVHSGVEKLGESQTYMQFVAVADRINYQSPFCNNLAFVLCLERLLDVDVPKRAQYARVILSELGRIGEHLIWLGLQARHIAAHGLYQLVDTRREALCDIYESIAGNRWMTGFARLGGLAADLPEDFSGRVSLFLSEMMSGVAELRAMWDGNGVWLDRACGVGTIGVAEARSWGLSGPVARAAGVGCDLRKDEPYSAYEEFDFEVPVGVNGDVYDRYLVRVEELVQSCRIISQALRDLPGGDYSTMDQRARRPRQSEISGEAASMIHHFRLWMEGHGIQPPPDADSYLPTESPNGELGFYIVSDGSDCPYRLRVRAPSFLNYQLFGQMAPGMSLSEAQVVLGSLNVVAGEVDR